ncbi:MAG: 6-phosphofructokinase [Anaerolineae bacterium]|nr:6-phosphofructokinase [Anaerolineae bacterium]NIN95023.1 6-phosphofructokinase [Anaerolineae bacterium]NIQ78062.1 6-phosphofructokinase [Anaerolineae bacterium]
MKRLGLLTSGGDAPGTNACIRAVVRTALAQDLEVLGIRRGYIGLMEGDMDRVYGRFVGGISHRGGTILQTARTEKFKTAEGQQEALRNLEKYEIDVLVIIGGDGSLKGALRLQEAGFPVAGVPATIDNDVPFTDMALGVDTAMNTALRAIDKIKDTATSHRRAFLVETMGRDSGYLALMVGTASGAEAIVIPEVPTSCLEILELMKDAHSKGKAHFIIVVAEGAEPDCGAIEQYLKEREEELGFGVRVSILGYIQRGGSPTAFDRLLGTRLGVAAVQQLVHANYGKMVGLIGSRIVATDIEKVVSERKELDLTLYEMAQMLEIYPVV